MSKSESAETRSDLISLADEEGVKLGARNRGPLFYRSLLHDKEQEVTATQVDTIDIGGKPLQVKIRTPR